MAAGLSMQEEKVEELRRRLNEGCGLTSEDMIPKTVIDVPMPISYIRRDLVEQLGLLEPFGKGNAKPVFAQKGISVFDCRVFGQNRNVVKMKVSDDGGNCIDGIYFGDAASFLERAGLKKPMSILYYPSINSYQGRENLQIIIQDFC